MAIWAVVIAVLSLFMVMGSIFNWDPIFQIVLSYLILLVVLAILHRIWSKTLSKRKEILQEQLDEIRKENEHLKKELAERS